MIKYTPHLPIATALLGLAMSTQAASITAGDSNPGGIGYNFGIILGANDSGSIASHVGAWSWEDQGIAPGGGEGWTHTSNWIAMTLLAPTRLTLTLSANAFVPYGGSGNIGGFAQSSNFFPGLTLWKNWDNDVMTSAAATFLGYDPLDPPDDHHTYSNTGNVIWAEDLEYLGHAVDIVNNTLTITLDLEAGQYTFALGSDAPSDPAPPRQGYLASFTTVPEPGSALLVAAMGLPLLARRRHRRA